VLFDIDAAGFMVYFLALSGSVARQKKSGA
jgi:hypothetical protein